MAERPENILQVLAGAAGAGLSKAGEDFAASKQQEKDNALQAMMMNLRLQEDKRAQETQKQAILTGALNLKKGRLEVQALNRQLHDPLNLDYLIRSEDKITEAQEGLLPGASFRGGGLTLEKPKLPTELDIARTGLIRAQTERTKDLPFATTLDDKEALLYTKSYLEAAEVIRKKNTRYAGIAGFTPIPIPTREEYDAQMGRLNKANANDPSTATPEELFRDLESGE